MFVFSQKLSPMRFLLFLLILVGIEQPAFAQRKKVSPPVSQSADSILFQQVKYRLVGPWRGGRSAAVAGSYTHKNTFYFGATGGGVWKTTDGGSNWKNISDKYFGSTIGAVAVAKSDENILYVGEGENTMRGNVSEGLKGMWRSNDGGKTWKNIGLNDGRHIIRIVIHPRNPDIVLVAVMGHLFGPNKERGIYKTTDGGKTWKQVLYVNEQTGASDLVMEPGNPDVFYAGTWRVIRTPYSLESGGEGSGLWKSTDGGETWKNITSNKGLPGGVWGITGIAVAPSNTEKLYAIIENEKGGLYTSNDAGASWSMVSSDNNIRQRAWYYSKVFVDPANESEVYVLNVQFLKSTDGGKNWKSINTPHVDHHDLWIDPEDGRRMVIADDGGGQVSFDGGANWSTYENQPTAQIYRVSTDNAFPYRILGAQQDNSTLRIRSRSYGAAITSNDWEETAGSESGYVVADPADPDIVYGGNYGGYLARLDHRTGENRAINVWPDNPMGAAADKLKYRFQWNFPIFFSPHNPKRLYTAGNALFVTENEGQSWEQISPDLTTDNKALQGPSGGPITGDNTSVEYFCTIFTATESSLEKDLLWTGSDDGLIHVSRDGGKNWNNVTPQGIPELMMWNSVEVHPFKKGAAYFAGTRYKSDDFSPYLFKTEDYGKTWKKITTGIHPMHFTRVVRADRKREGLLYAGTEYGMYISYDDGATWRSFQLNLPEVPITDLTLKNNDLIVATQGRSIYVLDDLTVVQNHDPQITGRSLHVFPINPAYRMRGSQAPNPVHAGMNPANGVVINFYSNGITDTTKGAVVIFDKQQKEVTRYSTHSAENKLELKPGMNQFVWDMQYPGGDRIPGMILWNGAPRGFKVPPGDYVARIITGRDSADIPFVIHGDPNYKTTNAEYEEQFNFLLTVRDKFNEVQCAVKDIREYRDQLNSFVARQGKAIPADIKQFADSINKKMTLVEETLYQTKAKSFQDVLNYPIRINDKLAGVFQVANSGQTAPPRQAIAVYEELAQQADSALEVLKKIRENEIAAFNAAVREKTLPVIAIPEKENKKN